MPDGHTPSAADPPEPGIAAASDKGCCLTARPPGKIAGMSQRDLSTADVPSDPAPLPARIVLRGETVRLEPIDPELHAADLYAASHEDADPAVLWRYMPNRPCANLEAFTGGLEEMEQSDDPFYFAIHDLQSGRAQGVASYLRITRAHRVIEIGAIWFGPALQRTRQATEALFLMMRHAMEDLGYRRLEWKCDAANEPSRRAALRLGFTFEGLFHQHMIVKGRNRDTAWYSILDGEWPAVRNRIERWLAPDNFDVDGRQKRSLSDMG